MEGTSNTAAARPKAVYPRRIKGRHRMLYFNIQNPKEYLLTFVGYIFGLRKY